MVGIEFSQVQPVVEDGPEFLVGKPEIILIIIVLGLRNGRDRHRVDILNAGFDLCAVSDDIAAPAKPQTARCFQCIDKSNGQPS